MADPVDETLLAPVPEKVAVVPLDATAAAVGPGTRALGKAAPSAILGRGDSVGRYIIVDKLGAGAMGIVYSAYDPELDRRVAVKLLLPEPGGGRSAGASQTRDAATRLVREAQALAQLAHPNIVGVHDVGRVGERVFVAMEYVEGETLGEWMAQHRGSELLEAFLAAGRGLQAAHQAGLLHRDFKPENVMVGRDGRVRVMDFGLARVQRDPSSARMRGLDLDGPEYSSLSLQLTEAGALMGTPAYMAPELFGGVEATPASDQFAFCVSLWEGLAGRRPFPGSSLHALIASVSAGEIESMPRSARVPSWLENILRRGLSPKPENRFKSVELLISAVEAARTRSRRRRSFGIAGGLLALVLAGEGGRRAELGWRETACQSQASNFLATAWSASQQDELRSAFEATQLPYASAAAETSQRRLSEYAGRLAQAHAQHCRAERIEKIYDPELSERARWCLDERSLSFGALVEELAQADPQSVARAAQAVSALPEVDSCVQVNQLRRQPAPPRQEEAVQQLRRDFAQIDALSAAARFEPGLKLAQATLKSASALNTPALELAARHRVGSLQHSMGRYQAAAAELKRVYFEASEAGWLGMAAEAGVLLVSTVGRRLEQPEEGRLWARHVGTLLMTLEEAPTSPRQTRLQSNLGLIAETEGAYEEARELQQAVLEARRQTLGDSHPDVASSLNNLAIVLQDLGDLQGALSRYEEAQGLYEMSYGGQHPLVATAKNNQAIVLQELDHLEESAKLLDEALAIRVAAYGPEHPLVADTTTNLASLSYRHGDRAKARELFERVLEIQEATLGPDHPDVALALNNLAVVERKMGEYDRAGVRLERAKQIRIERLGPEHPHVAASLSSLGRLAREQGRLEEAKMNFERAAEILRASKGPEHPDTARALSDIASVLGDEGNNEAVIGLYLRVLEIYETALSPDHLRVSTVLNNLGDGYRKLGRFDQARAAHQRALEIVEAKLGSDHPRSAYALLGLAEDALAAKAAPDALGPAERGLQLREKAGESAALIAEARFVLARVLWELPAGKGRDRARAQSLARAILREDKGSAITGAFRTKVESWMAARVP